MSKIAKLIPGFLIAVTPALAEKPAEPDPSQRAPHIEVDLSERTLMVYGGEGLINTFSVAIGREDHPTPTAEFTIDRIIWNPEWIPPDAEWARDETRKAPGDPDNPMQGAKIFFKYPDYYIHGTNATETIGTAASHGCLRMNVVDVENLAKWVQEVGGATRSEDWYERIRASDTDQTEVELPDPVRITIHW